MIQNKEDFSNWVNRQLGKNIPSDIIAFHFNLYEFPFCIELIGEKRFSLSDDDWACGEEWVPDNRRIEVSSEIFASSWENGLMNIVTMVKEYLTSDFGNSYKLIEAQCVAVGFVEGDLVYI
ncbi:hypothetical protein GCM10009347_26310 [Shewanella algicola]|uniref:Uncharacterized protein n=1 Tax=Shewanella algicola TaxID=640633 RepID=A0A9X2CEE2_9GAMM|nr:hypothetical protein [Shewanella algicola]MCL1106331.1 hypothetical protein [Shewanella algicola]GGP58611.1 hypothetical protein GCM10009347_26310 [Shewanella algicola]